MFLSAYKIEREKHNLNSNTVRSASKGTATDRRVCQCAVSLNHFMSYNAINIFELFRLFVFVWYNLQVISHGIIKL